MKTNRCGRYPSIAAVLCSIVLSACSGGSSANSQRPISCPVDQPFPYADATYVSNHVGPGNSNFVPCEGPLRFEASWHVLTSHAAAQPNTFSPDGRTTYLTTSPGDDGCTVHAVDTQSGETLWRRCDFSFAVAASAAEVDEDGVLYVTDRNALNALAAADGSVLWTNVLPDRPEPGLVYGLKFTADGQIVTQTSNGTICLVDRKSGSLLASLDVAAETGFVPPATRPLPLFLLPDYVWSRAAIILGTEDRAALAESISGLFGASGAFADNTVATSVQHRVFAIGGGPAPDVGAVVSVRITANVAAPSLELAWTAELPAGSASSVAVLRGGERVVVSDGEGTVHLLGVDACDRNLDADPDPRVCADAWSFAQPGRIPGALSVDAGGGIYFIAAGREHTNAIYALEDAGDHPEVRWARSYGESEQFSTVLTVTANAIYGLLTEIEPVRILGRPVYIPGVPLPLPAAPIRNRAVAIDPLSGDILWSVSAPNSSITELVPSPGGDLFLTMAGGAEILVLDPGAPDPLAGLMRFSAVPVGG